MSALLADASVVVKCLLEEPGSTRARALLADASTVHVPDLIYAECTNALWMAARRDLITRGHAITLVEALRSLPMHVVGLHELTPLALELSMAHNHPSYDCYYLAAAILSGSTLATADARLHELACRAGYSENTVLVA